MCMLLLHCCDGQPLDELGNLISEHDGNHSFLGMESKVSTFETITTLEPLLGSLGTYDQGVVISVHNSPNKARDIVLYIGNN